MANLYCTQTHRGLQLVWTGTDLTGVLGSALQGIFNSQLDNTRFIGGGTFSNPVISTVNGVVQSAFTYSPVPADVAASREGEWRLTVKATYGDGSVDFSTPGLVAFLRAP